MARPRKNSGLKQASGQPEEGTEKRDRRVAIYLRVSTEEQAKSGLGMDAQKRRCRQRAEEHSSLEPTIYMDEGISGAKDERKRPGLAHLLQAVRAGEVDMVIIYRLDRLGRTTRIILDLVEEISRHCALISCKENLDTSSSAGQFFLTITAAMAQYERDLARERTKAALREKELRDGDRGGELPYGYTRKEGKIRLEPKEARRVRDIFAWRAANLTYRAIAERLNHKRIPSPRGGKWSTSAVFYIVEREATYRGGKRGQTGQVDLPQLLEPKAAA